MQIEHLQPGDIVYAAVTLHNDGSLPELNEEALIAAEGARGVIVNVGHLEDNPSQSLLLVRFEDEKGELGPPVGCWPEELRVAVELA